MQTENQTLTQLQTHNFTRGMTLQQYMSSLDFTDTSPPSPEQEDKQQNLLEGSLLHSTQACPLTYIQPLIPEVDEESMNDSIDQQFRKEELKEQVTKQSFRELKLEDSKLFSKPLKEQRMRNTAYFNHLHHQPQEHRFRIKHVSNSPSKPLHTESPFNATLTLYGQKFRLSKERETQKVQQLVTFYGKMGRQQVRKEESRKEQVRKQGHSRGGHLQLKELIEFETRIKNNFSQKIYMKDLRVEGLKDRLLERKNKFC